jgi:hypothetical protein
MSDIKTILSEAFSDLEKEYLRIALILINPKDLEELKALVDTPFRSYARTEDRGEWCGELVGSLWGCDVISCDVSRGVPQAIPTFNGVGNILRSLSESRKEVINLGTELYRLSERANITLSDKVKSKLKNLLCGH